MLDIIKNHLAAFSASNWDEYKALLAKDAVYEEHATQQRAQGAEDFVKLIQRWKRAFPDAKANFREGFVSGDNALIEVEWEGTHTGTLEGPLGALPPTNKRGTVRAALVYSLRDGKIVGLRHYFDLLTMLRQLGVAPMVGTPGQAAGTGDAATPRH